jgi:hypothetical protein
MTGRSIMGLFYPDTHMEAKEIHTTLTTAMADMRLAPIAISPTVFDINTHQTLRRQS